MEEKGAETACGAPIAATSGKSAPFLLAGQAPPGLRIPKTSRREREKFVMRGAGLPSTLSLPLSDSSAGYFRASFLPNSSGDLSI